jgi:hypothetical protein
MPTPRSHHLLERQEHPKVAHQIAEPDLTASCWGGERSGRQKELPIEEALGSAGSGGMRLRLGLQRRRPPQHRYLARRGPALDGAEHREDLVGALSARLQPLHRTIGQQGLDPVTHGPANGAHHDRQTPTHSDLELVGGKRPAVATLLEAPRSVQ